MLNRFHIRLAGAIVTLSMSAASVSGQVLESDSLALVAFYHATNGDDWTNNTNWLTEDVSSWYGVTTRGSRVDSLNLSGNNLTGQIPITIGDLSSVKRLDFSDNSLTGNVPYTVGQMRDLEILDLSGNPDLVGTLSTELESIYRFRVLRIDGTNLCESGYSVFQSWLLNLDEYRPSGCVTPSEESLMGACSPPQDDALLDINNVRARVLNNGRLFNKDGLPAYEVPRGSGVHSIFSTSIWIGGTIEQSIRTTAVRSGGSELWAGPLTDLGTPVGDCSEFDHIYRIEREDIARYQSKVDTTFDLKNWPTGLGAPTVDKDGNDIDIASMPFEERAVRNIDLEAGELPKIRGDQAVWWIMNDRGNEHLNTQTLPLGVEVQAYAFAATSGYDFLNDATFFQYRIVNKNTAPIENAFVGIYVDADLGFLDDDMIGSDTSRGMGFVYNVDNVDEGETGYGASPPAVGVLLLDGPVADLDNTDNDGDGVVDESNERLEMTAFGHTFRGESIAPIQYYGRHYYLHMQGRWRDGKQFTVGGNGRDFSNERTACLYPGDPVTNAYWSEVNSDGQGTQVEPGDRQFFLSSGPFTILPNEENNFTFAVVWARGDNHLDSITALRAAADRVNLAYDTDYLSDQLGYPAIPDPIRPNLSANLGANFPEPFSIVTRIPFRVPHPAAVRITVLDVLGRVVAMLVNDQYAAGEYSIDFDGLGFSSGMYFYRIEIGHASATRSMMLVK